MSVDADWIAAEFRAEAAESGMTVSSPSVIFVFAGSLRSISNFVRMKYRSRL